MTINQVERVSKDELNPIFEQMSNEGRRRFIGSRDLYTPGYPKLAYLSKPAPSVTAVHALVDVLLVSIAMLLMVCLSIYYSTPWHIAVCCTVIVGAASHLVLHTRRTRLLQDWLWTELAIQYVYARIGDAAVMRLSHGPNAQVDQKFLLDETRKRYIHLRTLTIPAQRAAHDEHFETQFPVTTEMFRTTMSRYESTVGDTAHQGH